MISPRAEKKHSLRGEIGSVCALPCDLHAAVPCLGPSRGATVEQRPVTGPGQRRGIAAQRRQRAETLRPGRSESTETSPRGDVAALPCTLPCREVEVRPRRQLLRGWHWPMFNVCYPFLAAAGIKSRAAFKFLCIPHQLQWPIVLVLLSP